MLHLRGVSFTVTGWSVLPTMGDMKTPDFDDLLAAFDIPDMDTNETVDSGDEDDEVQVKQAVVEPADHTHPPADISAVSVIVKNTVCPEQLDSLDGHGKEGHTIGPRLLQNGFGSPEVTRSLRSRQVELLTVPPPSLPSNTDSWSSKEKPNKPIDIFAHFSPMADPKGDHVVDLIDQPRECKLKEEPPFELSPLSPPPLVDSKELVRDRTDSLFLSCGTSQGTSKKRPPPLPLIVNVKTEVLDPELDRGSIPTILPTTPLDHPLEDLKAVSLLDQENLTGLDQKPLLNAFSEEKATSTSPAERRSNLSALPAAKLGSPHPVPILKPPDSPQESEDSCSKESTGDLERSLQSPQAVSFDGEEEEEQQEELEDDDDEDEVNEEKEDEGEDSGSPSDSSRPLKVRIKTVKTLSGSIKRMVSSVNPDSGAVQLPSEQNILVQGSEIPMVPLSEEAKVDSASQVQLEKQVGSSPTLVDGSQVVSLQLGNGAKIRGTVLPVSTIQNASSVMLMAASVAQQKAVVLPTKTSTAVPKNIISLVPQVLPKSVPRPNISITTQPANNTLTTTTSTTAALKGNTTVVMVQAPKPSPPAAGTVISRTQSSLVEAFNKILNSKNLLPIYKPNLNPPAESCVSLPFYGYRCLECGDSFALEKSLARHYDRRSMRIEVTCNHCTKRLVFFNKCSLLLHAREHKDKGLVMQCSHLVMRPIALDQMIGQPDITPLVSVTALPAAKTVNSTASTPGPDAAVTPNGTMVDCASMLPTNGSAEQGNCSTFRCLECKQHCKNRLGLTAHFQLVGPTTTASSTVCSVCPMMMPNCCSFTAHTRMHKNRPPNVCPECGGIFRTETYQAHLKESCLHFSRRVGYRCPSCSVVFGGVNSIKSHIQTSHCEVFHKCPICPMAFKSGPSAHGHVFSQHPGFTSQHSKMIYKCAMCDTVFTHKPLLSSHFDQHLVNQRVSVFKCPDCPLLFAQKRTMLEHMKTTHSSTPKVEESPPPPAPPPPPIPPSKELELLTPKPEPVEAPISKESDEEMSSSEDDDSPSSPEVVKKGKSKEKPPVEIKRRRRRGPGLTCSICHSWFPEREEYVIHMKKLHGKSLKKYPCRLCERSFCSAPSLRRHVRVNHEGIKRVYPCRYCTEGKRTFSSRLILEKHIEVRHGIMVSFLTKSVEIDVANNDEEISARKRKHSSEDSCSEEPDSTTPPSKNHKTESGSKSPKPDGAAKNSKADSASKNLKPDKKSSYRCRKCGYVTHDSDDFQEHIPQHRTDESSHQCLECGLCFTSQGSLNRHRFITHKMKGSGKKEEREPQAGQTGDPSSPADGKLTCKVCNKSFDNQLNLKTHFRTHGMAFIKQRQTVGTES
ncbi:zinc finger protein 687 isoform X1 [Pleurodeles waltl]|uniref:zinc finger protein 687 isoform X1 n=1 Tax=Pleurodeles waltl TaxID=8319 RepID=UPI003709B360